MKLIDLELLKTLPLPDYDSDAGKAERGKLLIIAGSARLPGAAILCARAALRAGCGTVRVAAPQSVALGIGIAVPELMMIPLPETKRGTIARDALSIVEEQFAPCDAAVIGPGLDDDDETAEVCRSLIENLPLPSVIDAAALLAFANAPASTFKAARVWTPHEAEMQALETALEAVDKKKTDAAKDNSETAQRETRALALAKKLHSTLVFKGRETIIAAPDAQTWNNTAGTRGLGTAGSGDVLAGIIGGLLAQGLAESHAAIYGVHLHALAGEAVAKDFGNDGLMAHDFLERVPQVLRYLRKQTQEKSNAVGFRRVL